MLQSLTVQLQSVSPILLHNGQTADPLNKFSKAMKQISSKRSKTDADYEEMARLEWMASLYLKDGRIVLPDYCLESAFVSGAKKLKLGQQTKAGLFIEHHAPLIFEGCEMSPEALWERDENRFTIGVRVQRNKVMRTRFIARQWSAEVTLTYEDKMLNKATIVDIVTIAGEQCGMFDWRPKYGRYTTTVMEQAKTA